MHSDEFTFKPDTTLVREVNTLYIPGQIGEISVNSGICVRISKAAKCVPAKYAERYISDYFFGIILSDWLINCGKVSSHFEYLKLTTFEGSTVVSHNSYTKETFPAESILRTYINQQEQSEFVLNDEIFDLTERAVERVSSHFSLKTGDLVIIQKEKPLKLQKGDSIMLRLSGTYEHASEKDFQITIFDFLTK